MYTVYFEIDPKILSKTYEKSYDLALDELNKIFTNNGFAKLLEKIYILPDPCDSIARCFNLISELKKVDWFKCSVKNIVVFRLDDFSNFTEVFKSKINNKNEFHSLNMLLK